MSAADPIPPAARRPAPAQPFRVAVVHDQLYTYGGAERVLAELLEVFPEAEVYGLFDILPDGERGFLKGRRVNTTLLQRLPGLKRLHRFYFPLMPLAIEQLDLGAFDVVISSSYLVAKGVVLGPDQLHICYLHSPMRYAWDQQHRYLSELRVGSGLKGLLTRVALHYLRQWDGRSAAGVDLFLANSHFVARRARRAYRRDCLVLRPPVDVARFRPGPPLAQRDRVYVTLGRLVPAKRVDLLVRAFDGLGGGRRLIVAGNGPELERLRAMAGPQVEVRGRVSDAEACELLRSAQAFLFAAEEDFGIAPIEALAAGTPVIGLRRGGLRETVQGLGDGGPEAPTGLFYDEPTAEAVRSAVLRFEDSLAAFSPQACHAAAQAYAPERFRGAMARIVHQRWLGLQQEILGRSPSALVEMPEALPLGRELREVEAA